MTDMTKASTYPPRRHAKLELASRMKGAENHDREKVVTLMQAMYGSTDPKYLCYRFIKEKDKRHEECWRRTICTLSFRTPRHARSLWPVETLRHPTASI